MSEQRLCSLAGCFLVAAYVLRPGDDGPAQGACHDHVGRVADGVLHAAGCSVVVQRVGS